MRISILGSPGSGKTTLGRNAAGRLGAPFHEIDDYFHQPGWTPKDRDLLRAEITEALNATDSWVVDGNYNGFVGDIIRPQADTIVVFELPRARVMRQVAARTIRRAITREVLWNGNREPLTNFTSWDPEKNIIRYAWIHHPRYARQYRERAASGEWDHADVVWLDSHATADAWLASLPTAR